MGTMPMDLYAHEHLFLTGELTKGMHHMDTYLYTQKKEDKKENKKS